MVKKITDKADIALNRYHSEICRFLKESLPGYIDKFDNIEVLRESNKEDLKLFFKVVCNSFGKNHEKICKQLSKFRTYASRATTTLNSVLEYFCHDHKISPPIQLFYHSSGNVKHPGCHFACSVPEEIIREARPDSKHFFKRTIQCSTKIVSLEEAMKNGQALKTIINSDTKKKKSQQILDGIRKNLISEATEQLRKKLETFDINDYQPLDLEIGTIEHEQIKYLQPITDVLKIGTEHKETSEWFRKTGPIAIDFKENKVYRRESKVEGLIKLVMDNPFSLLIGEAATGKTVLVRDMAYTLYKEMPNIYYFKHRDFDVDELAGIINSTKGIIILEDMHLDTLKLQQLYYLLVPNQNRHVLFVLRSSFEHFQNLKDYENLKSLPHILLRSFEDVCEIVKCFCGYPETSSIAWQKRCLIEMISRKDYWLLVFAMQGCTSKRGEGEPIEWLEDGIKGYLQSLENCGDKYQLKYPKVILALSPLYMSEIFTHEHCLKKLGYMEDELKALCRRGEIVMKEEKGHTFYGLPHSSLAEAYWEHGRNFTKELPEYEDYVYGYITAFYPNSLAALSLKKFNVQQKVLMRLSVTGDIIPLIEKEGRLEGIVTILCKYKDKRYICKWMNEKLVGFLLNKIGTNQNPITVLDCLVAVLNINLDMGKLLWNSCNKKLVANLLFEAREFTGVMWGLEDLCRVEHEIFLELIALIDDEKIISRMNTIEDPEHILQALQPLNLMPSFKTKIVEKINFNQLCEKISQLCNIRKLSSCLMLLRLYFLQSNNIDYFYLLDISSIAKTLNQVTSEQDEDEIVSCISSILFTDEELGSLLLGKIKNKLIIKKTLMEMSQILKHRVVLQHGKLDEDTLRLIDKFALDKEVILKHKTS